jgi:hypothetical protein
MEKRCSLWLFCFALFIAYDPASAAQIEAVTEKASPSSKNRLPLGLRSGIRGKQVS